MKNKKSRRELCIEMIANSDGLSCQYLVNKIINIQKIKKDNTYYLSGTISSMLRGLVVNGTLEYAAHETTRGGHIYILSKAYKSKIASIIESLKFLKPK